MTLEQQLCLIPERCECNAKVLHQGSQVSACAVVKGTQRNLFVVPTAGTFEDEDLKSLEEEADADPSMKGQLMKKLHVSCSPPAGCWPCTTCSIASVQQWLTICRSCLDTISTRGGGSSDKNDWMCMSSGMLSNCQMRCMSILAQC
jgi:hypothetical protein